MRTLLLDADIIAYKFAFTAEEAIEWDEGLWTLHAWLEPTAAQLDDYIAGLVGHLDATDVIVCLTDKANFRKSVLPTYKANRSGKRAPMLLRPLKDHMAENYPTYQRPGLEADDVMGILSTSKKIVTGERIIVSSDKDMKTIPGLLFNPDKDRKVRNIPVGMANYWFLTQTLTGDKTDGYAGCPGCGPKTAAKILNEFLCDDTTFDAPSAWSAVLDAYAKKGLGPEEALVQARVARILRARDYDFKNKEVILWTPPKTE